MCLHLECLISSYILWIDELWAEESVKETCNEKPKGSLTSGREPGKQRIKASTLFIKLSIYCLRKGVTFTCTKYRETCKTQKQLRKLRNRIIKLFVQVQRILWSYITQRLIAENIGASSTSCSHVTSMNMNPPMVLDAEPIKSRCW